MTRSLQYLIAIFAPAVVMAQPVSPVWVNLLKSAGVVDFSAPVAAYNFDFGGWDCSGNDYHLTTNGTVELISDGVSTNAFHFDGVVTNYFSLASSPINLSATQSCTISLWFRLSELNLTEFSDAEILALASPDCDQSFAWRLVFDHESLNPTGPALSAVWGAEAGGVGNPFEEWETNVWYHIAFTWDHTTGDGTLYVDGTPGTPDNVDPLTGDYALFVGNSCVNPSPGNRSIAEIDELKIYDRVLSPDTIAYIASHPSETVIACEVPEEGPTLLIDEGFEGTGYEMVGWTEPNGTPNEDYTGVVLEGSQSLLLDASAAIQRVQSPAFSDTADIWVYFLYRPVTIHSTAGNFTIFELRNGTTPFAEAHINNSGQVRITTTGASSSYTTSAMSAGTTYHVWIHYVAGSGTNAVASIAFSSDGTKPVSGNNFTGVSNGTSTSGATNFRLSSHFSTDGQVAVIDKVRADDETIGDNPP